MRVAIVGAGICGLYLAWKLSQMGHNVTIFEKKEKIGKEACSGLFSERILEFIPQSQKLIQNQIEYCLIHWGPERTLKIKFSGRFFVMNHYELDRLVFSLAEKSGAKVLINYNVTRKELVTFQHKFDRVIGCDGALSEVRKFLELKKPKLYLAIQGLISQNDNSNFVETWPTKSGFIWKIPRGQEVEWGIIERPKLAREIFENFLNKRGTRQGRVVNLARIKSAIIPQGLIIPKNSSITLCGDAAGLTKPWSGGGVVWSLIAAKELLKNFPDFLKYQKEMKKIFLPKIIFSKIITKVVYFLGFNFPWILPKNIKIEGDFLI